MNRPLLLVTLLALGQIPAWGQSEEAPPTALRPSLPLDRVAPYSGWKTHRGTVEQALCRVDVADRPPMTGLTIRCDGFALTPRAAWQAHREKTAVRVRFSACENEESKGPFAVAGSHVHNARRVEYGLLKVNNHHVRCAPLLHPKNFKEGDSVRLLWTVPAPGGGFTVASVPGRLGRALGVDRWSLAFDGPVPSVPAGAVVADGSGVAALGTLPSGGEATSFSTWAFFHDISGEVGLSPDLDSARGVKPLGEEMAFVGGGPVKLSGLQCDNFVNQFKTSVACTPDFFCDKNLVTIAQWSKWENTLPTVAAVRQRGRVQAEQGSGNVSGEAVERLGALPASGVPQTNAMIYASSVGKRLMTEVEWYRASYREDLRIWEEREARRAVIDREILRIEAGFRNAIVAQLVEAQSRLERVRETNGSTDQFAVDISPRMNQFRNQIGGLIAREIRANIDSDDPLEWLHFVTSFPGSVRFVGEDEDDASDWGVFDVISNVPELVQGRSERIVVPGKRFSATFDPYPTRVGIWRRGNGRAVGNPGVVQSLVSVYLLAINGPLVLVDERQGQVLGAQVGGPFGTNPGMVHWENSRLWLDPIYWRCIWQLGRTGAGVRWDLMAAVSAQLAELNYSAVMAIGDHIELDPDIRPGFRLGR